MPIGKFGRGRERPPYFWPSFGRGVVAVFTTPPRPLGGGRSRPKGPCGKAIDRTLGQLAGTPDKLERAEVAAKVVPTVSATKTESRLAETDASYNRYLVD